MSRGLILFAHGSRDPAWGTTLQTLAEAVRARDPALHVRVAFLEWQPPTLPEVMAELAAHVHSLAVCPVFWAANGHVQRDLPSLLEAARQAHPNLDVQLLPVLSELPGMLGFLADSLTSLAAPAPRGA
jgi:sirohydrochlorin cobaltochelatase